MNIDLNARAAQAQTFFASGYNCSQSVFLAYADVFHLSPEIAEQMTLPFGGGMGGMREVCGCVCATFMSAGFICRDKVSCYKLVRELTENFKSENGSIVCKELLGLVPADKPLHKKPCSEYVAFAARLIGEKIIARQSDDNQR